jgi:pimeloyl-ACP methyl ester carboxylesterase
MDLNEDLSTINRLAWFFAKRIPIIHLGWLKLMQQSLKGNPEKLLPKFEKQFPLADYLVLKQPDRIKPFCETTIEAMRSGVKGAAYDVQLYAREWDFSLDEIQIPLTIFHGERDKNVPIAPIKRVVASLPTAKLRTYPEEGHLSLMLNQFEMIAKLLVENI